MSEHPILRMDFGFPYLNPDNDNHDFLQHATTVEYDGTNFDIILQVADPSDDDNPLDKNIFLENYDWQEYSDLRILGPKHANILVCCLLALLEAYGQPNVLNDQNIQDDYLRMVQEAKDLYAEKAFEQILDGLKNT